MLFRSNERGWQKGCSLSENAESAFTGLSVCDENLFIFISHFVSLRDTQISVAVLYMVWCYLGSICFLSYTTVQRGKTTVCTIYCHRAVSSLVCTGIVHLYRADGFGTCAFGVCLPGGNACHVSCGAMAGL